MRDWMPILFLIFMWVLAATLSMAATLGFVYIVLHMVKVIFFT